MIPHTRTILTPPPSHKHNTMLLNVMALARDIRRNDSPRTQSNTRRFPLCRVGLLRLRDADFETYAFQFRCLDVMESWGDGFTGSLLGSAALDVLMAIL